MRLMVLALTMLLLGCSGSDERCARLPGGHRYCLVQGPGSDFDYEQSTTVRLQGKSIHLLTRVNSAKGGLRFAGVTPLGQTIIQVSWIDGELKSELPQAMAKHIDAAFFPALLQLATWPAERVREGLSGQLQLKEGDGTRTISDGRENIINISWEGDTVPYTKVFIEMPSAGLIIESRSLEVATQ